MKAEKITVIGGGTMGSGIAQVFAVNGRQVTLVEAREQLAELALNRIDKNLKRMESREKITSEVRKRAFGKISCLLSAEEGVKGADLVIEAVPENLKIKKSILEIADAHAPDTEILACNTSSLSITRPAAVPNRPQQAIGAHCFNRVPVMKLV